MLNFSCLLVSGERFCRKWSGIDWFSPSAMALVVGKGAEAALFSGLPVGILCFLQKGFAFALLKMAIFPPPPPPTFKQ